MVKTEGGGETLSGSVGGSSATAVEDLTRSYCDMIIQPLIRTTQIRPSYEPSRTEADLGKPVINFKRFKKQKVRSTHCQIDIL